MALRLDPVRLLIVDDVGVGKTILLPHIIQRRRRDVEKWLGSETPFPERLPSEERYELGSEYRKLFEEVLEYCRERAIG
jgi:hypothetical protein